MAALSSLRPSLILSEAIFNRVSNYRISYGSEIEIIVNGIFNACVFCQAAKMKATQKKEFFRLILAPETAGKTVRGYSVLMEAAKRGNTAALQVLLSYFWEEANVYAKDESGRTALMHASREYGEYAGSERMIQKEDRSRVSLFKCHLEAMKLLLEFASDVNAKDVNRLTALHHIMKAKDPEGITLLLEKGADPNARGFYKITPSHRAAMYGNFKGLEELKKYKANMIAIAFDSHFNSYVRPMDYAAIMGQTRVIEWFRSYSEFYTDSYISLSDLHNNQIKPGNTLYPSLAPDVDPTSFMGHYFSACRTSSYGLRLAIECGHRETARLMCHSFTSGGGVPSCPSDKSFRGYNALHIAVLFNRIIIARDMISLVDDLQAKSEAGETALALAKRLGHKEIFHDLLQAGAYEE